MKFNRTEMGSLACQPGHRFDREGVMFIRERQDGFFRRSEICVERWCRLRGNLLFYFKSRDQWSEPAGVIVLENFTIEQDTDTESSTYGLILIWEGGQTQYLGYHTPQEREAWHAVLLSASHTKMRKHLENLQKRLEWMSSSDDKPNVNENLPVQISVIDPDLAPLLECTFTCDNLLCDAIGRTPSTRLVVYARNSSTEPWTQYGNTEIVERTSNPVFMLTVSFRSSDGLSETSQVKVCAQDTRERFSMVRTSLGEAVTSVKELVQTDRLRLRLDSPNPDGRAAGFVTISSWSSEMESSGSTESTPSHTAKGEFTESVGHLRRSQSLPPTINHKLKLPHHPNLLLLHSAPTVRTYRLHSGLGGDISVMELMAEPKFSFAFPQQLLSLWISEEKELVHEIAGLGELKEPCHSNQMRWLENHLNLINIYSTAMEHIESYRGPCLKKSSEKGDRNLEFIPTNLHLQRMWAENASLRKNGYFDIHTVGAFTAFAQKTRSEGLIRMLKELKSPQKDSTAWCSLSDRLQMAEDSLQAIRRVRREVVDSMRFLMKLAKERNPAGMFQLIESMLKKTKLLCSISDTVLVEEAFTFLEKNRVTVRPEKDDFSDSVAEFMQRNRLKIDLQFRPSFGSLQTPNTEFISKELRTPDPEYFSPSLDPSRGEYWRGYSAFTSGYQSVDRLSDIDEFEESFRYMSIEDKTRHYYTLCRNATPHDTPAVTPHVTPKRCKNDDISELEEEQCIPVEVAKSETMFSENDSALDDEERTENSAPLTDEEVDDDDYDFDDNVYHNDDEDDDEGGEDEDTTPEEDDESTPHVGSETSKTQSPSSVGKCGISFEQPDHVGEDVDDDDDADDDEDHVHHEVKVRVEERDDVTPELQGEEREEESKENLEDDKQTEGDKVVKLDNGIVSDNEASSHYRSGDEPEPIDLTHLNIEASMMCLASKIRTICGKANSPTLSNRTFRFRELDNLKKSTSGFSSSVSQRKISGFSTTNKPIPEKTPSVNGKEEVRLSEDELPQGGDEVRQGGEVVQQQRGDEVQQGGSDLSNGDSDPQSGGFKIPDVPKPSTDEIEDWAGEVRPSMRKLRQGMDSLLKSSRLVCSVLRLQQIKDAVSLTHQVKYRRDVCFSQALTSLVSALMSRLWCLPPDPLFLNLIIKLGPLVNFEGLLSLHGEDVTIINDMIVAVEDLRSVEFTLVLVERRSRSKSSNNNTSNSSANHNGRKVGHVTAGSTGSGCTALCGGASGKCAGNLHHVPMITCSVSSFPLPRVTGSRNSLKVLLPVPDWVYSQIPLQQIKNMTFTVTPVFFNIGINQHATIAEKLGLNGAQEKNNSDNFRILADYVRRFKKLGLFSVGAEKGRRGTSFKNREQHVYDLLNILKNEVSSHKSKNVDILDLASQITNQLGGLRFTSCKSGKDRTGMSATLEQVNTLSREFDLADTEFQRALDTFRSEGARRYNCEKNIGSAKYAFNSLQLTTFPRLYRPPIGTYGTTET